MENDYLMLSGIQHFSYCKRQWALIHLEQLWQENFYTVEGQSVHERVNDVSLDGTRNNTRTVRSMPLVSHTLKLTGIADIVEFIKVDETESIHAVKLPHKKGLWQAYPIEYKRGKEKAGDCDELQLCAQCICLEEMLKTKIDHGYIYYHLTKRRVEVIFTEELRSKVVQMAKEMNNIFVSGRTPEVNYGKWCKGCSLINLCEPEIFSNQRSAKSYILKACELLEEKL